MTPHMHQLFSALASDPISALLLLTCAENFVLAWIVARAKSPQGKGREAHRSFALLCSFIGTWALTNAMFRAAGSESQVLLWAQMSYLSAIAIAASFLHFSWSFPKRSGTRSGRRLTWYAGTCLALLSVIPGLTIRRVDIEARAIDTAPGVYLLALYILGCAALGFRTFYSHQKRLRGRARAQSRLVLYGLAVTAALGLTTNLFLPLLGNYRLVGMGPVSSLFFVSVTTFAIIAHHLFDVRLLIRRTLVYSVLLALLAGGFAAFEKGLEYLLRPLLGNGNGFSTELVAALVVGFAVDPLKRQIHILVSTKLFRGESIGDEQD